MAKPSAIYSPKNNLREPAEFAKFLFRELKKSWGLSLRIFVRDTKSLYREAFLGSFWLFLPAIALALSLGLAAKAQLINVSELSVPYPAYVVVSTVLWQLFQDSVKAPVDALEKSKKLLAKIQYPVEANILAEVWQTLFNFSIKLVLIVSVFVFYKIKPNFLILFFPLGCLSLVILGLGLGLLLCPFSGLYKDVAAGLPHLMGFLMLLTPVFYGDSVQGTLKTVIDHNPLTFMIATSRDFILGGNLDYLSGWILIGVISVPVLMIGWIYLRLSLPLIIERSGN
jgi:lipopolysaccharide transport system permease protein